jgi:uncharacterized membrane protein
MLAIISAISTGLHALATVVFIGHYLLLSLVYVPVFSKSENGGNVLGQISRRSRPWLYASLIIFFITGIYLMLVDPSYLGIGNFANPWAVLMLVKHILILVMIGLGFWFNAILRVGQWIRSSSGAAQGLARFRNHCTTMSICGILVLLLTAFAQIQ